MTRRDLRGHAVAALGGLALAASLWLPWYSFHSAPRVTAWQAATTLPIVLLVCAVIGGGLAALAATGRAEGVSQLVALAGGVGVLLVLFRLAAPPLDGQLLHPAWGLFLSLGGALAMVAGGTAANRSDARAVTGPRLPSVPGRPRWSTRHSVPPPSAS
jgi:peptidoglycan/LPS O-acetylase OafA/YrhL